METIATSRLTAPLLLLAEVDSTLLNGVPEYLSRAIPDLSLELCSSSDHAIAKMEAHSFDAAIYNVQLAAIDNFWLLSRHQDLHPETPFIVTAAPSDLPAAKEALHYGAFGALVKPVHFKELVGVIQPALHVYQLRMRMHLRQERVQHLRHRLAKSSMSAEHQAKFGHGYLDLEQTYGACQIAIDHLERSIRLLTRQADDVEIRARERASRAVRHRLV